MKIAFFADINDNHNQKWFKILAKKHELFVFTEKNNQLKNKNTLLESSENIKIFPILEDRYSIKNLFFKHPLINEINHLLLANSIDIVHSIYAIPYSFWAFDTCINKHIITTYGSDMLVDYNQTLKKPLSLKNIISFYLLKKRLEKIFNNAAFITSTSSEQQKVIKTFVKDDKKLSIIRTGVDCNFFIENIEKYSNKNSHLTILSNRAMRPLYNIDLIVDAFKLLIDRNPKMLSTQLVLLNYYTDEEYYRSILNKIKQYNLQKNITILSELEFADLIEQYACADLVIMIPSSDGTPVSGVETLLSKKPLILGDLNYDIDLFNEDTTWRISSFSIESVYDTIQEVLSTSKDVIESKTEKGRTLALNNADVHTEIKKIEHLYHQIMSNNGI
ncbi:MAG: glycosyltransferase family 4 protein [Bacteroidia bacterium]|nr:glycosyltransferase family 4 protein [Bacteroidia bacterium]